MQPANGCAQASCDATHSGDSDEKPALSPAFRMDGALAPLSLKDYAIIGYMNRRDFIRILPLPALPAWMLGADEPQTVITVHVTKQLNDKPLENAYVILDFLGGRQALKFGKREKLHWEMRTNLEGIAHFPAIRRGKVRVQVIATDYQTFGQVLDLDEAEKKIDVKLLPPQKQYSVHGDMVPGPAKPDAPKQDPPQQ